MKSKSQKKLFIVGVTLALGIGASVYGLAATSANTSPSKDLVAAIGTDGIEGYIKTSDMNQDLPQTPEEAIQSMNAPKVDKYINLYDSDENIIGKFLLESSEDSNTAKEIDLKLAKHMLKESDRPALDILQENLIALVQHDHKLYRSGFVDDQLADAMDFYYGEQFQYKFSSIESIEKHASIKNQLHITVLGERLDTTTDSVEQVRMMYAIRQSEQGDWDIYTID
ncbi:hypothetical protein J2W91_003011 [Paenibacillus amylolyticus]|uniref:Uncharacterized protein n=1 Tax=Paenibacillus amylolyticus TaxID=1451 RepID=A0AAP5H4D8_PAEAM|nr:hypothetical protein [Paenibacillus amylolyticus]MDR6724543.1 hypothetical protein [Paenibacillus amylolyticus]